MASLSMSPAICSEERFKVGLDPIRDVINFRDNLRFALALHIDGAYDLACLRFLKGQVENDLLARPS